MATVSPISFGLRSFFRDFWCTRLHVGPLSISGSPHTISRQCTQQIRARHLPQFTTRKYIKHQFREFLTSTSSSFLPPPTLADPTRPTIFYHLLAAPNPLSRNIPAYAVSFLENPPTDTQGAAVLGWLPAAANSMDEEAGLGDFKENSNFINVMHDVIKSAVKDGTDTRLNAEAIQRGEGWIHINDERNVPAMGRINSPEDIIASVFVEDGRLVPHTYNPMPTYRICTADGLTTLSEGLQAKLLQAMRQLDRKQMDQSEMMA